MKTLEKQMMAGQHQGQQQQPQGQVVTVTGPTVTVVDDDQDGDRLVFLRGQNPHKGPPDGGTGQTTSKQPSAPKHKVRAKRK